MTLYREEFICVCVGRFLWKKSLEIQRLLISTASVYSISTSTTARNQEAASGSFSLWCFVFAHAYFRKVGNPRGMKKQQHIFVNLEQLKDTMEKYVVLLQTTQYQ